MKFRMIAAAVAAVLVLAGCTSEIASVTVPTAPEPGNAAGSWSGSARWDAVQGGAPAAVTSGAATAIIFQSGAAIAQGSRWEVTGAGFTGTLSGTIDPAGNLTGTATVTVTAVPCTASAAFGGELDDNSLAIVTSFADPGTAPCAGAPVGLTLTLGR